MVLPPVCRARRGRRFRVPPRPTRAKQPLDLSQMAVHSTGRGEWRFDGVTVAVKSWEPQAGRWIESKPARYRFDVQLDPVTERCSLKHMTVFPQ